MQVNRANRVQACIATASCVPVCRSAKLSSYVVVRFAKSFAILKKTGTGSQASYLIPRCPVTAVSAIGACGCRYPTLHLCHSAPMDQQSNFTQARSEGGNADVGMRIYASGKTRHYWKRLRHGAQKELKTLIKGGWKEMKTRGLKGLKPFLRLVTLIKTILFWVNQKAFNYYTIPFYL